MTIRTAPRSSDRICASCARPAVGYGIVAKYQDQVLWCCGEPDCFVVTQDTYTMQPREFGRIDQIATIKAGEAAGEYLDSIGKSDLAELTEAEWNTFLLTVVGEYRFALHETLRGEAPF